MIIQHQPSVMFSSGQLVTHIAILLEKKKKNERKLNEQRKLITLLSITYFTVGDAFKLSIG